MFNVLDRFQISSRRLIAIMFKEFRQMLRDPATSGMMIGTPLLQLILFGYAINMTPTNLPTIVMDHDHSPYSRIFIASAAASRYFAVSDKVYTNESANDALVRGNAQFVIHIPENFGRALIRGDQPGILVDSDATDPVASSSAITALEYLARHSFDDLAMGPAHLQGASAPTQLFVHAHYNPLALTRWNIIPGLIGVVLTMTLVMVVAMALAKESEAGTKEFILATPATPIEVVLGKITPYLLVGYVQILVIVTLGSGFMGVPFNGSVFVLLIASLPYIIANLSVGLLISTVARTQIQASVCSIFFFLPSLMLSGFFFPFRGMPEWAQWIGNLLPLSHYLVVVRGIMLKGASLYQLLPTISAIVVFAMVALSLSIVRYRGTLD